MTDYKFLKNDQSSPSLDSPTVIGILYNVSLKLVPDFFLCAGRVSYSLRNL